MNSIFQRSLIQSLKKKNLIFYEVTYSDMGHEAIILALYAELANHKNSELMLNFIKRSKRLYWVREYHM